MGREIRKVPGDWEHPRYTKEDAPYSNQVGQFKPLHDQDYESACREWIAEFDLWRAGKHKSQEGQYAFGCKYYWEYSGGPPDKEYYRARAWTDAEATHFQVYETVSEGTPVTPAFPTREALAEYLATHGDYWDQQRGDGPWGRAAADSFCKSGWAPSLIVKSDASGTQINEPRDGMPD